MSTTQSEDELIAQLNMISLEARVVLPEIHGQDSRRRAAGRGTTTATF